MKYCLYQAVKKIRRHLMVYILIILQISVAVTVIVCALNYSRSTTAYAKQIYSQVTLFSHIIKTSHSTDPSFADVPITPSDFRYLQEALEGKATLGYENFIQYMEQSEEGMSVYNLVFVSPEFSSAFLGQEIIKGTSLVGEKMYQKGILQTRSRHNGITFDEDGFTLSNKKRIDFTPLQPPILDYFRYDIFEGYGLSMEECIFLSIEDMDYFYDTKPMLMNCVVFVMPNDPEDAALISEIKKTALDYLSQQHGGDAAIGTSRYTQIDLLAEYDAVSSFQAQKLPLYMWIAYLCTVIMVLGFTGHLIIQMVHRQKEIAVRQMLGAGRFSLFFMLFSEVSIVCLLGSVLGLIMARPATAYWITSSLSPITYHKELIGIVLVCALALSSIPTLFAFSLINKDKPSELLKSL